MEPISLDLNALVVETFAVQSMNLSSPQIVETGCVMPCEGGDALIWR